MLRGKLLLLFCLGFYTSFFSQENKNAWELQKNENGISVFSRKTAGSDYKELKAIVYLTTSLKSIVALIYDWDSYPQWVYKCENSSTLKKIGNTEVIHYQSIRAPWPVENRDFVMNVKLKQDELTKIVTIATSIPQEVCRRVNLGYCDPRSIDLGRLRVQHDDDMLVVENAGQVLHRLRN